MYSIFPFSFYNQTNNLNLMNYNYVSENSERLIPSLEDETQNNWDTKKIKNLDIFESELINLINFYHLCDYLYKREINNYKCHKSIKSRHLYLESYIRSAYRNIFFTKKAKRSLQCYKINKILNAIKKRITNKYYLIKSLDKKTYFDEDIPKKIERISDRYKDFMKEDFQNSKYIDSIITSLNDDKSDLNEIINELINFIIDSEKNLDMNFYHKIENGDFENKYYLKQILNSYETQNNKKVATQKDKEEEKLLISGGHYHKLRKTQKKRKIKIKHSKKRSLY